MKSLIHRLFPDRIGRIEYSLRGLVFLVIAFSAYRLMYWWQDHLPPGHEDQWSKAATFLLIVLLLGLYRAVLVPRLQDADMSRAWALLMLIPPPIFFILFLLIFLLVPTNDHPRPAAIRSMKSKPHGESTPQVPHESQVRASPMRRLIRFFFPDRSDCSTYFLRGVVFLVLTFGVGYQFDQLQQRSPEWRQAAPFLWMVMILILCRAVVIPRLEDAGWNRAWTLLILVPFINLLFIVKLLDTPSVASDESPDDWPK